jgi:hypothetical protein
MSFEKISWRQFFHPKTLGMKLKMSGANFFGATTFAKMTQHQKNKATITQLHLMLSVITLCIV